MNEALSPDASRPAIRWWPALLILVLAAGAVLLIQSREAADAQAQFLATLATVAVAALLLVLWLLLASRLPGRSRLRLVGGLALAVALFALLFRIEGVTGNFVPIVSWRFGGEPELGELAGRARTAATAWDSPRFLGPTGTGEFPDAGLSTDWQGTPPKELWRRAVGDAWSSFAVVGSTAVTMEQREHSEWVVAYDLASGNPLWTHAVPEVFESVIAGNGPRATPTIADGRVFVYGATGVLRALSAADGHLLWRQNVRELHPGPVPEWGHASSPLVTPGGLVVVVAGGDGQLMVAFDAASGEKVWAGGDDRAGYASPSLLELGGVPQVVTVGGELLVALDPMTGRTLWQAEFSGGQPNVAQPLVLGDGRVLASKGYGVGSKLYEVAPPTDDGDGWRVAKVWDSPRLKSKFANMVVHEGVVYGLDDGVLVALDPATGERLWKRGRYGHGQILLVGDTLLVQTEDGELVLVAAAPEEHRELARMPALSDKSWNQPALAGRILLVRNHKEAVAYELPIEG